MNINPPSFYNLRPLRRAIFYRTAMLNISAALLFVAPVLAAGQQEDIFQQNTIEAQEPPKSILFPSGVPGPYFPDDAAKNAAEADVNNRQNIVELDQEQQETDDVVEIDELGDMGITAFGSLNKQQGGFNSRLWRASSRAKIEQLLGRLVLPAKSPTMDEIEKKLLLTIASAPVGKSSMQDGEEEFDEESAKKFINLRISKLMERGNLSDLTRFPQGIPQKYLTANKSNAELLLLGGDLMAACQMTNEARAQASKANLPRSLADKTEDQQKTNPVFWLKMLAFCRVLEEDISGAQIALDLLGEQGSNDFIFFDLINLLMENPASRAPFISGSMAVLDGLNYSLLSLLDQPVEAQLIENSDPLILSALVINPNMSKENRLQGAVKSYLAGGISVDVLRDVYDLQEFSSTEYQNALMLTQNDQSPLADVLLYQAAARQSDDVIKAEILKVIWDRALSQNDLSRKTRLNIKTLISIKPSLELLNHADHITRGLLLGGELDGARKWYDFVRRSAISGNAEATRALINIWPMVMIASAKGEIPWNDDILELWWNGQMVLSPQNRDSKAALFYAIAEAFQYEVGEEKWAELITEARAENAQAIPLGVWREMIKSVAEDKQGQAIILSLMAMGQNGPGSLDASGISAVLRTLRSFGLEQEARNVALEALVANDF